jgi:hypothetical protein
VSDMNENVRFIPFSNALAKVMVLGIVTSNWKIITSFMFRTVNRSPLTSTRRCPTSMCGPCSLLYRLMEISFFPRMVCLAQFHFHPGVLWGHHSSAVVKHGLVAIFSGPEPSGLWHLVHISWEGHYHSSP